MELIVKGKSAENSALNQVEISKLAQENKQSIRILPSGKRILKELYQMQNSTEPDAQSVQRRSKQKPVAVARKLRVKRFWRKMKRQSVWSGQMWKRSFW